MQKTERPAALGALTGRVDMGMLSSPGSTQDRPAAQPLNGSVAAERAETQAGLGIEYRILLGQTTFPDLAPLRERGVGGPGLAVGPAVASLTVERGLWRPDPDGGRA